MNMYIKRKEKLMPIFVSLGMVLLLVLSGPASAFNVKIKGLESEYQKGSNIIFDINSGINSNELVDLEEYEIKIGELSCKFDALGNNLSICNGIEVDLKEKNANYGYGYGNIYGYGYGYSYGYGYGYGSDEKLVYNVSIDSNSLAEGTQNVVVSFKIKNKSVENGDSKEIQIKDRQPQRGGSRSSGSTSSSSTSKANLNSNVQINNNQGVNLGSPINQEINEEEADLDENSNERNAPITGAAIGAGGKVGYGFVIVIAGFILALGLTRAVRAHRRRQLKHQITYYTTRF